MKRNITTELEIYEKIVESVNELSLDLKIEHIDTDHRLFDHGYLSFIITDISVDITNEKLDELILEIEGKSKKYSFLSAFLNKLKISPSNKLMSFYKSDIDNFLKGGN